MSGDDALWVGADPGGKGNFGIAILVGNLPPITSSVGCADEALAFVQKHARRTPAGAGVDAPLWWSSGKSGDRHSDQWLRSRYGLSGGEVQAANSMWGAALVQGPMLVLRLREAFPGIQVTESHPKALLKAVAGGSWDVFAARFQVNATPQNEHARDALIAAVAAREGFGGRWTHDLGDTRLAGEQDPKTSWLAPIYYYWPDTP